MTPENAEILALEGLGWLAGDPEALERFLRLSGVEAADLREAAGNPQTGVAVLDFFLAHEAFLVRFCADNGTDPKTVLLARHRLNGDF